MDMRVSRGILGKLYRDVSNQEALKNLVQHDYRTAIQNDYELDPRILNQTKNSQLMHSYLHQAYETIVAPMTARLKTLMLEMNFGCEAELFTSDLRYKMFDDAPES